MVLTTRLQQLIKIQVWNSAHAAEAAHEFVKSGFKLSGSGCNTCTKEARETLRFEIINALNNGGNN